MKKYLFRLVLLSALASPLLTSCILTLGAPLIRKVEPHSWVVETGGGLSSFDSPGLCGYSYVGKSLGDHFEIGLLPYAYQFSGSVAGSLFIPLRWDPFPNDWSLHLVPFVGPSAFWGEVHGMGVTGGVGLSWQALPWLELHTGGSTLILDQGISLFTLAGGTRLVFGSWEAGASAMYTYPGFLTGLVSVGVVLGGR